MSRFTDRFKGTKKEEEQDFSLETQNILNEIREDVHREKLLALWNRYKVFFIGGCCGVITLALIYGFYQDRREGHLAAIAAEYAQAVEALNNQKVPESADLLNNVINSHQTGFEMLAHFLLADALSSKDISGQKENLRAIFENTKNPLSARGLARVKYALIQVKAEDSKSAEIKEILAPLLERPENPDPWSAVGTELLAALEYANGNLQEAYVLYHTLSKNPQTSSGIRDRALRMVMILNSKGIGQNHANDPLAQDVTPAEIAKD